MNAIQEAIKRLLRGPRVSGLLRRFDIDPRRFWLLMDLFDLISERGEMLDQLGRNGLAMNVAVKIYAVISVLLCGVLVLTHAATATYFGTFLVMTAFLLTTTLLSETGNSLVNPTEGLVLAHQPINGATYTAAKLSHLARIVLYFVPALNGVPALAGLLLKNASWWYPFVHLAAAIAVGLAAALLCCAIFGWLIRFIPVRRLRAAGQFAGALPFFPMMFSSQTGKLLSHLHIERWIPVQPAARWTLAVTFGIALMAAIVLGIRSLSADYLLRVSTLVRGGASAGSHSRGSLIDALIGRFFGGPPGRAGSAFISRMMLRDWQFRRQLVALLVPAMIGLGSSVAKGWPVDPFSRQFVPIHLLPHLLGMLLFFACLAMPYGSDYKGAWIFLLAPSRALGGFAWGVYARLWIAAIVIPHAILLPLLSWRWGIEHGGLFIAYSLATASIYLALELRLIEDIPFTRQVDPSRGTMVLPIMLIGGVMVAVVVGIQYYFIFRSETLVAAVAIGLGIAGFPVTRASVRAMTASIRYNLGVVTAETGTLYKEV